MVTGGGVLEFNWPALGSNLIYYLAFYFQYKLCGIYLAVTAL